MRRYVHTNEIVSTSYSVLYICMCTQPHSTCEENKKKSLNTRGKSKYTCMYTHTHME